MSNCKSCGNSGCGGSCTKKCIKVYRPTVWRDGQTGIPGSDGAPGVGIVNIVDNMDGSFTIFLSDGSDYTIVMPAATGKHVVAINPVPGGDNTWELVYDDATTLVIPAAYYLNDISTGASLLDNEINHPTFIKGVKALNNNSKIVISDGSNDALFNVKQWGTRNGSLFFDAGGGSSYMQNATPRYQNAAGSTAPVSKSGGGSVMSNQESEVYQISFMPIDAYKGILYWNIVQRFDITYNDFSYQQALNGEFSVLAQFNLPHNIGDIPLNFWRDDNAAYNMNHSVATYDMYIDGRDNKTNKHRRYHESKICDAYLPAGPAGSTDPGWIGDNLTGFKLCFRYPVIKNLTDPAGGNDVIETIRFNSVGSMMVNIDSNTDELSAIPGYNKNH